ncbi:VOC family protein [Mesorhizobium sp. BH1-1-5]|uniref:VOC family protein n=1 Tax=Mesorhizobium sp. BH1-1-5 TaxID=2876661 RepID=UPI001CCA5EFE|nr:VOC family protein [Mesorhizobium sp. BH1-1-5]MBZ9987556.1 VOC family protein [Mesorhizobium sp. BH1-1-5]
MPKITTCLWFDGQAEEAMNHYVSIFKNSKVLSVMRWPEGHAQEGQALVATFELDGVPFQALNGGPQYKFSEAMSQSIDCKTQAEVDHFWTRLTEGGGEPGPCGWLKDKFGVSWQVVPEQLPRLLQDPDRAKAGRVMDAMMKMGKIEIDRLEAAAKGMIISE